MAIHKTIVVCVTYDESCKENHYHRDNEDTPWSQLQNI